MTDAHINLTIEDRPALPSQEAIISSIQQQEDQLPSTGNSPQTSNGEVQEIQSIQSVTSENSRSDLFIYANLAAQKKLKIIQTALIANFAANILGILLVTQVIRIFVVLIIILASLCLLLISLTLGKIKIKDKKEKFFCIAQIVSLGAYLIVAGLRFKGIIDVFYFAVLPSCVLFLLEIILLPPKQIPFVLKAAFLVQILLLSLKFDGIALNWTFTLLILVCATFMIYLITLMSLICWLSTLSKKKNFIWNTGRLLLALSVISWTLIILSFTYFTQESILDQRRQYVFLSGAIYCLGLFCSSVWFKNKLTMLFKQRVLDSLNIERTKDLIAKKATFKNVNHEELYFTKISNTFFCQLTEKTLKRTHSYPTPIQKTDSDLEEQNKSAIILDNNLILEKCLVCFDKEANSIFLGCYHGGMCSDCAKKTWAKTDKCHICRGKIDSLLKLCYDTEKKCLKVTEKLVKIEEEIEISLQLD